MIELKFIAQKPNGQLISGTTAAGTYSEGKKQIKALMTKHRLKLNEIQKKSTFIYKIKKGNEAPVKGEQRAFTKEEVKQALAKMGYQVISVNKFMFEWDPKPPAQEILSFVKISAELLEQKLPYSEIMTLLINDLENKTLRESLKQINNDLKRGADSQTTFLRHERIFGKFTAYMLGLAAKSGNMVEIYKATAKFLERKMQFNKDIRSALITPAITMFVLLLAVLFYVGYIFPETAKLFLKFDIPLPPLTSATLQMSDFLINQWFLVIASIVVPPVVFVWWGKTEKGNLYISQYMMKVPIMGGLIHKTNIEVFCRVFYTLYSGSAESIEPIRIASEATDNAYFEQQIKKIAIPMMISKGAGVSESFAAAKIFTDTAISRFHSGEESGTIKNTALQLANYYESETVFRLKNVIEMIQVFIAMVIMVVMIALTLVSAETATINPTNPASR